ncbi:uncharacterized protein MEPE_04488 [Melanopsichium pennsylvanicum]|uniref:Uncharacterized protein n=2 Tax=Melanopsichium pennsylvanicum TaxID=63383 RepID=A0AAJ4XMU8_9BASI|nr:putative protein [Melanopsichium pennsylvanicum 4]SNX85779.1 uncharacterized protein MEPE_04488 [Melanopsichium pennsylvanicum]
MVGRRSSLHPRNHIKARKRAKQPDSLLLKHYSLFNSLIRYTLDDPASQPSHSQHASASFQAARARVRRADNLKERYPIADIWSYQWPKPSSQLPAYSQKPNVLVDELVERLVKETFDRDYEKFRSPEWAREHKITKKHAERIVVDPKEVNESAAAAKALVQTVLTRFIAGVKKGAIGEIGLEATDASLAVGKEILPSFGHATGSEQQVEAGSAPVVMIEDAELDAELEDQIWQEEQYALEWKGLLDYFQSTAGSSKTAQWRNWHLLNAISKTRQRCEELFGHESR